MELKLKEMVCFIVVYMEKIKTHQQNVIRIVFIVLAAISIGDFIQFVQYLYNLNFQEAMNKIIDDFSLPIKTTGYYDKNKILEMQRQRELEQKKKDEERLYFIRLCKRKDTYNHIIEILEKQITEKNWEDLTYTISYFTNKVELLNLYICDRYNIQN